MIPLCSPKLDKEMIQAALNAMETEFFVLGESVYKFEEEFARYCNTDYAVSVHSGTSALQLSLIALGIKAGEKVITTPHSFIATSNTIIMAGGVPIFADIEPDTGNIDAESIKQLISREKNIKGILPVHIYGQPCDMDAITRIADKKGLFVIEDACQAHGALYKNKKIGSIGDVGCFSFYSTKNMTVGGDGGMITTNNPKIAKIVANLRDCGRISKYEHDRIGTTSRLNTINAAIGRVQLKRLDEWNEKRRRAAKVYQKKLPEEVLLKENMDKVGVYHIFAIRSEKRERLVQHLSENGIVTGVHYPIPIHLQPIYRELFGYKEGDLPVVEQFSREVVSLPMFPEITEDQITFVCERVLEVI